MIINQQLELQIDQWIAAHKEELIRDLDKLIQIRSVSEASEGENPFGDECRKALDHALALGERYGFSGINHENYCGSILWKNGEKEIAFITHIDVVPEGLHWNHPPFALTRKDGYLIGRGVGDDKGAALLSLYVLRCLKELGITPKHTLRIYLGCSEETGMEDILYYIRTQKQPDFAIVPDSSFPVCNGEKGIAEIDLIADSTMGGNIVELSGGHASNMVPDYAYAIISGMTAQQIEEKIGGQEDAISIEEVENGTKLFVNGVSSHAAMPEGSVNAIRRLCDILLRYQIADEASKAQLGFVAEMLADYRGEAFGIACEDEPSGYLTCIGGIVSLKDGAVALNLNIRYPVTANFDDILPKLQATCEARGFSIFDHSDSKPTYVPADSPEVQLLTATYNRITGRNDRPYIMGGGTYARKLKKAVVFGPEMEIDRETFPFPAGHGGAHQPDECVNEQQFFEALKIYILSLLEIDGLDL